jgi:hypothetical protein
VRAAALLVLGLLGGCTFGRIVRYGPSNIDDHQVFAQRQLPASEQPFQFQDHRAEGRVPRVVRVPGRGRVGLEGFLRQSKSVAFLVIEGDASSTGATSKVTSPPRRSRSSR